MRACEADRCDAGATVNGRWCERHAYPTTMQPTVKVVPECTHSGIIDQGHCRTCGELVLAPIPGATLPAPEYALEGHSDADPVADAPVAAHVGSWSYKWATVEASIADAAEMLDGWRAERVKILVAMRESGMSLGDIAEVTGLTRQRIGQLLKAMP